MKYTRSTVHFVTKGAITHLCDSSLEKDLMLMGLARA